MFPQAMNLVAIALAVVLTGCASAANIKPGVVRGLERGYIRTTEGLALATRGCADEELWRRTLDAVRTLESPSWQVGKQLRVLQANFEAGRIDAIDERTFVGTTSYVGIFLHRLAGDLRLLEVSAFWKTRMTVTENPWEMAVLRGIEARLSGCVIPAHVALQDPGQLRWYPLPMGRPAEEPAGPVSDVMCRRRANAGYTSRAQWSEDYRRCMAGD